MSGDIKGISKTAFESCPASTIRTSSFSIPAAIREPAVPLPTTD